MQLVAKRIFDLVGALLLLILLSPIMILVGLFVARNLGRPVLFQQIRPGLNGRPFRMYKFRSMFDTSDAEGQPLPDEQRLPPFGRFLRSTSLDELPELLNVIKGEMSLVGPRPLLMSYLDRYTPAQSRRHEVKPGITGWTQVRGRNALTWEEKFALDVWYLEHMSLLLDLKILVMTIGTVLNRRGISAQTHATMPEFQGTPQQHRRT